MGDGNLHVRGGHRRWHGVHSFRHHRSHGRRVALLVWARLVAVVVLSAVVEVVAGEYSRIEGRPSRPRQRQLEAGRIDATELAEAHGARDPSRDPAFALAGHVVSEARSGLPLRQREQRLRVHALRGVEDQALAGRARLVAQGGVRRGHQLGVGRIGRVPLAGQVERQRRPQDAALLLYGRLSGRCARLLQRPGQFVSALLLLADDGELCLERPTDDVLRRGLPRKPPLHRERHDDDVRRLRRGPRLGGGVVHVRALGHTRRLGVRGPPSCVRVPDRRPLRAA
mmetsp:Transcript_39547/g.113864  ORF Transcript_39547/g.113864 Transcript_39547/m.113864 type:complete len:283 (-) Transcript_39547:275-1123(-)